MTPDLPASDVLRITEKVVRSGVASPASTSAEAERQSRVAAILTQGSHPVSHRMVTELLRELGYSLQVAAETQQGRLHPDRDTQFR